MISEQQIKIGTEAAFYQAQKSFDEGGVPVGSALLIGECIVSLGHNRRYQKTSNILHGETDCIENAGHNCDFKSSIIFTTLAPCQMCAGAILLYKIPKVVVLDVENAADFTNGIPMLKAAAVDVIVYPFQPAVSLMRWFKNEFKDRWLSDVGR